MAATGGGALGGATGSDGATGVASSAACGGGATVGAVEAETSVCGTSGAGAGATIAAAFGSDRPLRKYTPNNAESATSAIRTADGTRYRRTFAALTLSGEDALAVDA
jgi:hypothetical protein